MGALSKRDFLISGEGNHYLVKGSGYDQVQKMDQWSNSNQAGVWMFKIGHIDHNESIKEPKLTSRGEYIIGSNPKMYIVFGTPLF